MMGYRHKELKREAVDENIDSKANLSYEYNKNIHKMYRGHRDTNFIDGTFIEQVMLQCTSIVID